MQYVLNQGAPEHDTQKFRRKRQYESGPIVNPLAPHLDGQNLTSTVGFL